MLFAVPDQVVCGPARHRPDAARRLQPDRGAASTSYRNQFYGNVMGRAPGAAP